MKKQYSYIVVEDVELQRENLISLLNSRLDLQLTGSFPNAKEAYDFLMEKKTTMPDVIFLDIEMPEVNGFNLLEAIKPFSQQSKVIITTAFPDYAIKGYDYNLTAYLLKPIDLQKLNKALDKAIKELNVPETSAATPELVNKGHIFIKEKNKRLKIEYNEILYCEGANVDVKIITPIRTFITRERVKNLEQALPATQFLRVHDSFIVNLQYIKGYTSNYSFVDLFSGENTEWRTISIGPKYREVFRRKMKEMEEK